MFIKSCNKQNKELTLSIYNNNVALVNELRDLFKGKVINTIEYCDISKFIYENSVIIENVEVSQLNFNYKCCNNDKNKSENSSCNDCLSSFVNSIDIEVDSINSKNIRVYYLTAGVKWDSSYTLILNENKLSMQSWINISNKSGISYNHANLKCISGEVNFDSLSPIPYSKTSYANSEAVENPKLQPLDDYYIYNLSGKYILENNSTKRIKNFSAENIEYTKLYDFGYYNTNADILIKLNNTEDNNLGIPMPSGTVNIYASLNDSLQFLGSDSIKNTPINQELNLNIGKAFDITCERKIINYQKYDNYEFKEIELIINNSKDEDVPIKICYPIFAPWEITSTTDNYEKDSNGNPCFKVKVSANSKKRILFTYKTKIS